jgi:hypothetical protein
MPFAPLLWAIVSWFTRTVVLKFVIMGIIYIIVSQLTPLIITFISGFVSPAGLTTVFSAIPSGVWFFLDFFALDVGLPLVISAYATRFMIRRIPFIG